MATPTIPSATSIVDYLNTKKQDSSFSARKKLYTDFGIDKRLGDFVGGANQNLTLLKELQRQETAGNQTPAPSVPIATPSSPTATPTFNLKPSITTASSVLGKTQTSTPMTAGNLLKSVGFADIPPTPSAESIVPPPKITTPEAPSIQSTTMPGGATPDLAKSRDEETFSLAGMSAASLYPDIFGEQSDFNEATVVNDWLNSSEGKLFLERQQLTGMENEAIAEAAKQELETRYQSEKETLENNLAANGLAFSGIRGTQVKALADSLAASELKIDRELATKLLDANLDLREAILEGVADLAKQANEGRKEAIQQLNSIGYAVINGQLVPTLSALAGERAERSQELSERRLQLAEESAARGGSTNKLTLSEATSRGLPSYLVGTSEQEVATSFYDEKAPDWFKRKVQEDNGKTLPAETIEKLWEQQAPNYREGIKDSENHKKAVNYFSAFPNSSPDLVEGYANRVDFHINGGLSYADALAKVQKEINEALKKAGQKKIDWNKL